MDVRPYDPVWPARLAEWAKALQGHRDTNEGERLRSRVWSLLFDALAVYLRGHARHFASASREDVEDLASDKALELLSRLESGDWSLAGRSAGEIAAYLSNAARFGLLDHARRSGRERSLERSSREDLAVGTRPIRPADAEPPAARAEARELIASLRECAGRLQPRARLVWLCRACYEMSSQEIGALPEVLLSTAHVDVVAQRARDAVRHCLSERGHADLDLPPGAFVALWAALRDMLHAEPADPGRGRGTSST